MWLLPTKKYEFALGMFSCSNTEEEKKDYITISGKITNSQEGDLVINSFMSDFSKTITVKEDGTFEDTLRVPDSICDYIFTYGDEFADLFLENGDELSVTLNTEEFDESLLFEGKSAKENNFLSKKEPIKFMELIAADNLNFEMQLQAEIEKKEAYLNQHLDLNPKLIESEKKSIHNFKQGANQYHDQSVEKAKVFSALIGNPSPSFENYTNPEGQLVSIDQFKGKYTYIDIWATWCAPCKAEIPSIKDFMSTEAAKKMNVVSISVDEEKATENWKKMILEKEMNWNQLKADSAWNSSFVKAYAIKGIPRFILLDPKGNVVNPDAPRPSSEEFKTMIEGLEL